MEKPFSIPWMLYDSELPRKAHHPGQLDRYLDTEESFRNIHLYKSIPGNANWGADFSLNGDRFVCRASAIGGGDPQELCIWDWHRQKLLSSCKYPVGNRFYTKFLESSVVVWDRESCCFGLVGVQPSYTLLLGLTQCSDAVDAIATLPDLPHEILVADDKGVIYMKDIRTRALNILGRIKIITSDCQSISSLERNPCKSEEFSICSSWGRRMLIGDIRKTVQVVPETTIPHTEYQFFHLRGPDTFSAGYNYRGDRMLIHWENGVMYSEKDYGSVSAFQRVFSTHLDLFDAKFFGSRQMHVVIGYQKSSMSTGTDTIEVRRLPDPSKPFSGALLVSTLTHPSRNMYEDNREVCANFGLRLYVNPRFPVFAVGSSDGRVFFYRSSLI